MQPRQHVHAQHETMPAELVRLHAVGIRVRPGAGHLAVGFAASKAA